MKKEKYKVTLLDDDNKERVVIVKATGFQEILDKYGRGYVQCIVYVEEEKE
jgi:hypothetical protein